MKPILSSASKIVFLIMAITICVAFLFEVATSKVTLDPKDFMMLAAMAFSFYFAAKPTDPASGEITK